ncbi:tetratricopeptide repeat protein [Vibrio aestuarianus]|uniref:Tetratricopeptide repeat protein n=1 Tax=Vibrio aestuarianus TaxID=28171 RepID=A0AAX3U227_9VIBR|nr:tetratricopeptide repeat protein [Vibrio aestuarianus]WGK80888.1 tetratricopeptide repeat protein [Vibrio aestuarianus]
MNINKSNYIVGLLISQLLYGCASPQKNSDFNEALYSGKPIDTLTSDTMPLNEKEAIMRGDLALQNNNVDLALYEYILSLTFPQTQFKDKTLYNIGQIHNSKGNQELAERAYLLALDDNANNIKVLEQLGIIYMKSGSVESGSTYFYRALNADQVRLNSGKSISANQELTVEEVSVLSIDNYSPAKAYMGIGILADIKKHHKLAQAFYNKVLQIEPKSVDALLNTGYSYYMAGDYKTAQRFTVLALEKEPDNEKAQNNLALIYLAKGEETRAVNVFMRHMDAAEALNNVGYFLILQGESEKAIPYLQQAINKKASYYAIANQNLERALAEVRAKTDNKPTE